MPRSCLLCKGKRRKEEIVVVASGSPSLSREDPGGAGLRRRGRRYGQALKGVLNKSIGGGRCGAARSPERGLQGGSAEHKHRIRVKGSAVLTRNVLAAPANQIRRKETLPDIRVWAVALIVRERLPLPPSLRMRTLAPLPEDHTHGQGVAGPEDKANREHPWGD